MQKSKVKQYNYGFKIPIGKAVMVEKMGEKKSQIQAQNENYDKFLGWA